MEREVNVRCRKDDVDLVQGILDEATRDFIDIIKRETNFDFNCKIQIDPYQNLKDSQSE